MGFLNKDEIFGVKDDETVDVEVPEWGGTIRLRSLSGAERDRYESSLAKINDKTGKQELSLTNVRARLIALSAVTEDGRKLFDKGDDVTKLGAKNARPLDRLYEAALKVSGMSQQDVEAAVEDFGDDQSENSTSD